MKVWLVDDEQPCLDEMIFLLKQYPEVELGGASKSSVKALEAIVSYRPDAVFLDIDMPGLDGLELALRIQEQCPGIIVVFVTAYGRYALEAYKAHPLDFLLKPVRKCRLDDCMEHLHRQFMLMHPEEVQKRKLSIQCFGDFRFQCGTDIKWGTRRVRELLLYLIGRNGSAATKSELLEAMFDGREDKNTVHNLYMTVYRLKSLLDSIDPQRRNIRLTGENALLLEAGICDYTDFLSFARSNAVINRENAQEADRVLGLCKAPYLEKESFQWSCECSYEVEAEYERMALGLGSCHIAAGRLNEAEQVLNTLLQRNPLCEEAHNLLLDLTLQAGVSGEYTERYEQYERLMKKELHIMPKRYYMEKYQQLKDR